MTDVWGRCYEQNVEVPPPTGYTGKWIQKNAQADTESKSGPRYCGRTTHP